MIGIGKTGGDIAAAAAAAGGGEEDDGGDAETVLKIRFAAVRALDVMT